MFNFTTTNFINSALYTDGTAKYELVNTGTADSPVYPVLNVNKNLMHFDYPTTEAIYWRAGDNGAKAKITVNSLTTGTTSDYLRIALYIRLAMADQDAAYSNNLVFKGMPLYIEYLKGDSVATIIQKINTYQLAVYGKKLVNVSKDDVSGKLVIEATNTYQMFSKVELQELIATANVPGVLGEPSGEKWVTRKTAKDSAFVTVVAGRPEFGTYHQLTKDMVLPTYERIGISATMSDERPIPGALYDQITIIKCAKRDYPLGVSAVGEVVHSKTTHVFYVLHSEAPAFLTALKSVKDLTTGSSATLADKLEIVYPGTTATTEPKSYNAAKTVENNYPDYPSSESEEESDGTGTSNI